MTDQPAGAAAPHDSAAAMPLAPPAACLLYTSGSILGARLAWHAPHRVLTRGFATVLLLIAAYQLLAAVLRR